MRERRHACGSRSATRALPDALQRVADRRTTTSSAWRSRCATAIQGRRRSSSPRTSTCASAPTRSASTPRTTRPSRSTSRSSTRATARSTSPARARRPFYADGALSLDSIGARERLHANQYLLLRDRENPSHTALGRFDGADKKRRAGQEAARGRVGHPAAQQGAALRARSPAQRRHQAGHARRQGRHRQDAAGDRRRPAEGASRRGVYQKLLVSRPIFPLGRDIGYLPGDIEEKLNPWMQPIYDNVELLLGLVEAGQEGGPHATRS